MAAMSLRTMAGGGGTILSFLQISSGENAQRTQKFSARRFYLILIIDLCFRFRKPFGQERADEGKSSGDDRRHHGDFCRTGWNGFRKCDREPRGGCSQDSPADIGRKTFAGAAQLQRKHQRNVISPKTELRDGEKSRDENSNFNQRQCFRVAKIF